MAKNAEPNSDENDKNDGKKMSKNQIILRINDLFQG